jgi:hypothetical protein
LLALPGTSTKLDLNIDSDQSWNYIWPIVRFQLWVLKRAISYIELSITMN